MVAIIRHSLTALFNPLPDVQVCECATEIDIQAVTISCVGVIVRHSVCKSSIISSMRALLTLVTYAYLSRDIIR